jgi:transcriptional regulator with XRE-family HTH domain
MARMSKRPKQAYVWYRGLPYTLDLLECRRALVQRQVQGKLDSMESLAQACKISRSTASRFFSGRPTSLAVTLKILAELGLTFEEVAKQADDEDQGEGPSGVSMGQAPAPRPAQPGAAVRLARECAG